MARLIGLGGYAQSGKDTVADYLATLGWVKEYMSRPLETALLKVNPWVRVEWDNWKDGHAPKFALDHSYMRYADLHGVVGYDESKNCFDVRDYLQKLGTEVGRNMFDEDVWVRWAFSQVDAAMNLGISVGITGVRFGNELEWVRNRFGLLLWVERPGYGPVNGHASDNSLCADDFDCIIVNDGTIEELYQAVDDCLAAGFSEEQAA